MRLGDEVAVHCVAGGDATRGGGVGGEATLVGGDIADGGSTCDCFGAIGEEAVLIIVDDLDLRGGNEWWWRHRLVDARRRGGLSHAN
jgi:hypothetical protein